MSSPAAETAMPTPLPTVNTPEWRAWRRYGMGASDLPVLLGLDPYTSERELALEKRGLIDRPRATDLMNLGHEIEDVIANRYARDHGVKLQRFTKPVVSARWPHAFADPDRRVVGARELVEIKWRGAGWDVPPERVEVQALVQMGLTNTERVHVAVMDAWGALKPHTIERDEAKIDNLLGLGEEWFARYVLGDELPPIDGSKGARQHLDSLSGEGVLDAHGGAHPDMDRLMADLRAVRLDMDGLTKEDARLVNLLCDAMAGHAEAEGDGWRIAYKRTKPRTTVEWKLIAAGYRALLLRDESPGKDWAHDVAALDAIEGLYTTTGDGSRPFRPTWG